MIHIQQKNATGFFKLVLSSAWVWRRLQRWRMELHWQRNIIAWCATVWIKNGLVPAYKAVAARYEGDPSAVADLVENN